MLGVATVKWPRYQGTGMITSMGAVSETAAFEQGIRPLLEIVLPDKKDAVIGFRAHPQLQARIEELAQKSTEGHNHPA